MASLFSRTLFWKLFIPICGLLMLCAVAAAVWIPSIIQGNVEQEAVLAGLDTAHQIKTVRQYYTDHVVAKLLGKGGLKTAVDHVGDPDAVPTPSTMVHDLSALFKDESVEIKIYSPFPFDNRKGRKLDQFGQDAWTFLSAAPDKPFSRTESVAGKTIVRVAIADKMTRQTCVSCHNAHPLSSRKDWKLGDLRGVMEVSSDQSKQIANGQRITTHILGALGVMIVVLSGSVWFIYQRGIAKPLQQAVEVADRITTGDLTCKIDTGARDEAGRLFNSLKIMQQNLVDITSRIMEVSDSISTASNQIAAGNNDLSSRTEQQAANLEETASSMEQLTSTVKQNADNAQQANQLAVSASDVATKGGHVVSQVVDTMDSINESARKIVDIIGVIDSIAFQTNILALNAAVEAARAGEQGRGFAAVATEVRNLAQRSATAAKEIKALIGDSVARVDVGSKLVKQAGTTMQEIVASVKRVTDIMAEITIASQEQSVGIEQVNRAIAQMDQVTQQNAALVEQAAAATESLQNKAENLAQVVNVFKLVDGAGTTRIEAAGVTPLAGMARVAKIPHASVQRKKIANSKPGSGEEWEEF